MRIAGMSISAHPVIKTSQTAPTTPDVGLLTDAGSVGFSTEELGLQPGVFSIGAPERERHGASNESVLIGRAPDSADVRQS
jgi:hypothetical protein